MLAIGNDELTAALNRVVREPVRHRVLLDDLLRANFERLRAFSALFTLLRVGYSVKTNPRAEMLREALRCGFYAETISPGEVKVALEAGFTPEQLLYNGPRPAVHLPVQPNIVFADTVEAYESVCEALPLSLVGIRLRPTGVRSRFGVPAEQLREVIAAIRSRGRRETAVSFQVRSEDYGSYDFRGIVDAISEAAVQIERRSGSDVAVFDVGGGRSPAEFDASVRNGDFQWLHDTVATRLPTVREIVMEPGQELDFSLEAMVAPVLEIRRHEERREIVIDAGRPDFPEIDKAAHRAYLLKHGRVTPLRQGGGRILGRTCLEDDIIAEDVALEDIQGGDAIVIADVGAYDASMQYAFAQGLQSGNTAP